MTKDRMENIISHLEELAREYAELSKEANDANEELKGSLKNIGDALILLNEHSRELLRWIKKDIN